MAHFLLLSVLLIFGWTCDVLAQSDTASCYIPPGMYENYQKFSHIKEPSSGRVCNISVIRPVQRIFYRCVPRWCNSMPCNCNSTDLLIEFKNGSMKITCYTEVWVPTNYQFVCCPGYHEVDETSCIPDDLCQDNYLNCQYNCLTSNNVSTCTCPTGYQLNTADNRTCTELPTSSRRQPSSYSSQLPSSSSQQPPSSSSQLPSSSSQQPPSSSTQLPFIIPGAPLAATTPGAGSTFPYQYIIAAVVGPLLFLLLLALLIYSCVRCHGCCCFATPVAAAVDDEIKKDIESGPYVIAVVGLTEKEKDLDNDSIKKDKLPSDVKTGFRGLNDNDSRAQPNIYSSLSKPSSDSKKPAVSEIVFPDSSVKVSDVNSEYAEIGEFKVSSSTSDQLTKF